MEELVQIAGWVFLVWIVAAALGGTAIAVTKLFLSAKPLQIMGTELPVIGAGIDLSKQYDIAYGAGYGYGPEAGYEKLTGVRILGYLRGERDAATGNYMDSRWLVVELPDGRKAYPRPRSVLWLLEARQG